MKAKSFLKGMAVLMSIMAVSAFSAFAAGNKAEIGSVNLQIDSSDIEIGSAAKKISVSSGDDGFTIQNDEGTALNMQGNVWKSNTTPQFKVILKADSEHKFNTNSLKTANFYKFSGAEVGFVKATGTANSITLTIKTKKLKANPGDLTVGDVSWRDESGVAEWSGVDNAEKYLVKLYRGSQFITSGETTGTSYDFRSAITQNGNYSYKIRAYAYGSYGDWVSSEELEMRASSSQGGTENGRWILDAHGWWFLNPDRSYPANTWKMINGKWYYFNKSGYMKTGWVQTNGIWYYLGADGAMLTNTRTPDGYYVNQSGAWVA